jgi:peptidoglycan/xylan/chitin deacetylase (PgdA/CDA1 family)
MSLPKLGLRTLASRAFTVTPLPEIVLRHRAKGKLAILGYHRVLPPVGADFAFNDGVISATPEAFARQLKYVKSNLDVISVADLAKGLRDPRLLPERPALITFDDGYRDNHDYALPLLREAGVPACFFVCTGLVGTRRIPWYEQWVCCLKLARGRRIASPFGPDDAPYDLDPDNWTASYRRFRQNIRKVPWSQMEGCLARLRELTGVNPDEHLRESLFMTWDDLRRMAAAGMEIGGHTRTHPVLSRVDDPAALREEVAGCFDDLAREMGRPPLAFAYPWGHVDAMSPEADAEIERAGFGISFSFRDGFAPRQAGRITRLPRIHSDCGADHGAFRIKMALAESMS